MLFTIVCNGVVFISSLNHSDLDVKFQEEFKLCSSQRPWEKENNKNGLRSDERISLVQFSHSVVSDSLRPHGLQHARPLCPSPTPRVYSNSCPLSQ